MQQLGTLESGNVIVALTPDFFQEVKQLLEYYKQNEERIAKATYQEIGHEETDAKGMLTAQEYAEEVKCTTETIRQMYRNGKLGDAAQKVGGKILINRRKANDILGITNNTKPLLKRRLLKPIA